VWLIREKQEKAAAKEKERQEKDREKQEKAAEREKARQQKEAEKQKEKAEKEVMPNLCCCLFLPVSDRAWEAASTTITSEAPLVSGVCLLCLQRGTKSMGTGCRVPGKGCASKQSVLTISVGVVIVDCKVPLGGSVGSHLPFWQCIPDIDQVMSLAPRITGMLS